MSDEPRMTAARLAEIEAFLSRQRELIVSAWENASFAAIRDLLAELRRREWQPIETAPKDGTWIIAWPCYSGRCWQIRWREEKRQPGWEDHMGSTPVQPTHWQPMPEPPSVAQEPFLDTRTVGEARSQTGGRGGE